MKKEKQEEAHEEELLFENKGTIKQLADELLELLEQNSEDQGPSSSPTAKIESTDNMDMVEQALEKFKEKNLIYQTTDQRNPELTDEVEKANLLKMVDQALEFFEERESYSQENNEKNNQFENSMIEKKTPVETQKVDNSNKEFSIETETKIVMDLVEQALEKFEDQTIMPQAKEEE